MILHPTQKLLSSATLSSRYFVVHFDKKYWYLCAYHNSKMSFTLQLQEQKIGRGQLNCSSTLLESYCTQPSLCCPLQHFRVGYFVVHFDEKYWYLCAYHNSKMSFTLQLQEQKIGRGQLNCSSTLLESYCTQPSWCCPLQHFQMIYFVRCTHTF